MRLSIMSSRLRIPSSNSTELQKKMRPPGVEPGFPAHKTGALTIKLRALLNMGGDKQFQCLNAQ